VSASQRAGSDPILARLLSLHPKIIDLSLQRLQRLLADLGHPERSLPPVVHIAGTNGKGSTAAMLRAGLEAAGWRVHAYHSPHLVRFHERIVLAGTPIREPALATLLERVEAVNRQQPITFFEITTAAALLAFAETEADCCVVEVGLGGRLDATNVIPTPRLSAITRIGLDHQEFLGGTLAEIAREKAGILKPGVPGVIGPQPPAARKEIVRIAHDRGTPLFAAESDWTCRAEGREMIWEDADGKLHLPLPRLPGAHQVENAGIAAALLRLLGRSRFAKEAVTRATWPARLQTLHNGPLLDILPPKTDLILDGGHNPDAGTALAREMRCRGANDNRPTYLIVGMMENKDCEAFFSPFQGVAAGTFTTPIAGTAAALAPGPLAAAAQRTGLRAEACESPRAAAERIALRTEAAPRVLVCGSLYLAGELLREHR